MKRYFVRALLFLLVFLQPFGIPGNAEATMSPSVYQGIITYLQQYHELFDSLQSNTSLARYWGGLKISYAAYEEAAASYGVTSEKAVQALKTVDDYFVKLMESMATYLPNTTAFFLIYIRPMTEERGGTQVGDLIDCASSGGGGTVDVTQESSSSSSDPSTQGSGTNSGQGADSNGNDEAPLSNTCVIPPDVVWQIVDKLELYEVGDYFYALSFSAQGPLYTRYMLADNSVVNAYTVPFSEAYEISNYEPGLEMGLFIIE